VRPIDRVLKRLENVRQQNGYFMAACPAHDDREPSLSIKEVSDGRVLIKCHAGCVAQNILEAMGLKMSDLFEKGGSILPSRQGCNGATPPTKPAWE
jgi:hypothetical protein